MDRSVAPGADFYRYASGCWLATAQIPADKPLYATFLRLADLSEEGTRQIVETASGSPGSDAQRILATLLVVDPHCPVMLRAATVRNLDAWYDAFKPQPGDALYLAPDQRVRIW